MTEWWGRHAASTTRPKNSELHASPSFKKWVSQRAGDGRGCFHACAKPARGSWQLAAWWIAIYRRAHLLGLSGIVEGAGGQEPMTGGPPSLTLLSAALSLPLNIAVGPPATGAASFQGTTSKRHPAFSFFPPTFPYKTNFLKSHLVLLLLLLLL